VTVPHSSADASAATVALAAPVLPRVNLMPPEIAEAARFRRFQLAMGGAVVAAVAIVGALFVHEHSQVSGAQAQLDAAQARHAVLQNQLTSLQNVKQTYADVAMKQQLLSEAMGDEIRWSYYLTDLSLKVPDNVWLTNITAASGPGAASGGTTPAAAPGTPGAPAAPVANLTFSGVAFAHDDVATWLDMLAQEKGFANPYFSNSAESAIGAKKTVDFSSTVDVTAAAESGRYSKPAGN
jgi:Tfp pilus assembly protein PilN